MYVFREAKKKLAETTPKEVLDCIQAIVDKNSINSCCVTIKQLALEILRLSIKFKLDTGLPEKLAVLDDVRKPYCFS